MEWIVCIKKEQGNEQFFSDAASEAVRWFFEKNHLTGDPAKVYDFLKRVLESEKIDGDYGRLFFREWGTGLELQKFSCTYGLHDDHSCVTSIYLDCATEAQHGHLTVGPGVQWMCLEEDSKYYRKEWFDGCSHVKVFLEEETVMGSYYGKITIPVFFISDIPGASGNFVVKKTVLSD